MIKRIELFLINFYKKFFSFTFRVLFGGACRFTPTCSEYSKEAIGRFGVVKGTELSVKRLLRCHPWGKSGYDPVPQSSKS